MARLVSELGADVIDDTPRKPHKIDPRKRNYIIGFSVLGVLLICLGLVYYFAVTDWLSDFANMKYITYSINSRPDTDGIFAGQITASISRVDYESGYPSDFKVPRKINGYPITRIDDEAFQGCDRLKRVELSDNIVSLGERAFIGCENLKTIKFSKNLSYIGKSCFDDTAYKASWDEHDFVYVNNILLNINESKLLEKTGKSQLIFVNDEDSPYISEYPSAGAFSLETLSYVNAPLKGEEHHITLWMSGLFEDFDSLRLVEIPSYLDRVTEYSFEGCNKLEKVVFGENNQTVEAYAFSKCSSLTDLISLDYVSAIGDYAFQKTAISLNELHEGVTSIGNGVFRGCENITSMRIPASLKAIADEAFSETNLASITYASEINVTDIGDYAFRGTKLSNFTFPRNVKTISDYVLADCENLTNVYLYNYDSVGATRLDGHAFESSTKLESIKLLDTNGNVLSYCTNDKMVYLPSTLTRANDSSTSSKGHQFENTAIEGVYIPNSLNSIGEGMFANCEHLSTVSYADYQNSLLRNVGKGAFKNCVALEEIELPNAMAIIGTSCFEGCTALRSVKLPDPGKMSAIQYNYFTDYGKDDNVNFFSVLNASVFAECTSLEDIEITTSITKIAEYSFKNCKSLLSLTIPSNVTTIIKDAFMGCDNLYVSIEADAIPAGYTSGTWNNGIKGYALSSSFIETVNDFVISHNNDDKTLTIIDYVGADVANLVIPESFGEKKVTGIGPNFFKGNAEIETVSLPNTLTYIGEGAFENCANLTYYEENGFVYLGNSDNHFVALIASKTYEADAEKVFLVNENVCTIMEGALNNSQIELTANEAHTLYYLASENNPHFLVAKGITSYSGTSVSNVAIDDEAKVIAPSIFVGINSLKNVYIPSGVTKVSRGAFVKDINAFICCEDNAKKDGWDFNWSISSNAIEWATLGYVEASGMLACENLDHTVRLVRYTSKVEKVVLPSSINDKVVSEISSSFMVDNDICNYIYIPNTVTKIGEGAFKSCSALKIYCEAASIGANWAEGWNDENYHPVYFNVSKETQALYNGIYYLVEDNHAVATGYISSIFAAVIPSKVTINEQEYPVTEIGEAAFRNASSFVSLRIPSSVTTIGDGAFSGCFKLKMYFEASEKPANEESWNPNELITYTGINSSNYVTYNGLEYILSGSTATVTGYVSNQTSIVVPNKLTNDNKTYTVDALGNYAFNGYKNLDKITFETESLATIGDYAFKDCVELSYIVVPSSVGKLGTHAFENTAKAYIYFVSSDLPEDRAVEWDYFAADDSDEDSYEAITYYKGQGDEWDYNENGYPTRITKTSED